MLFYVTPKDNLIRTYSQSPALKCSSIQPTASLTKALLLMLICNLLVLSTSAPVEKKQCLTAVCVEMTLCPSTWQGLKTQNKHEC